MRTTAILVAAALASLGNASAFTSPPGSLLPRAPSPLHPSTPSSSSSSAHNSGRSGCGLYCEDGDAQKGEGSARSNTRRLFLGLGLGLSVQASSSSSSASVIRMSGGGDSGGKPSVGFLGMGIMGIPMTQNLLKAGFDVTVWNRNPDRCAPAVKSGAKQASSPAEVTKVCDITFAMLSDPAAAEAVAFGDGCEGAISGIGDGRGYVDCSTVSVECSQRIAAGVRAAGGQYLEGPVSGSKKPAEDGALIFLCAGDEALYKKCGEALDAMGKKRLFLGEVGAGANMKLVVNMVMSTMMASLSEGMTLSEAMGLKIEDVLDVMANGAIANPMFALKGPLMAQEKYPTAFPLKHAQKDMRLALLEADNKGISLPVASSANEQYKRAKGLGKGDDDFCAVHAARK